VSVGLTITLERPEATFERGETITGQVTLRADAPLTLEVPIHFEWYAHGKGESASESLSSESLFTGVLSAGELRTLPFSFVVPDTADPYAGEVFQVELRLRAVAAIAGEPAHLHPEARAPVRVAATPPPKAFRIAPVSETAEATGMGCLFQSLGIILLGGLIIAVAVAVPEIGFVASLGGTVVALGIALALIVRKRALAERKVGAVGVSIVQEGGAGYRDAPGSAPLTATVTTASKSATAKVRLRVQESSRRRVSDSSHSYHVALFDETIELADTETGGTFRGRIPVPAPGEVPLPFRRGRNRIEWEVFVTVDAPGAPEWLQVYELEVTGA
jgi:hypothetical protein